MRGVRCNVLADTGFILLVMYLVLQQIFVSHQHNTQIINGFDDVAGGWGHVSAAMTTSQGLPRLIQWGR